MTTFANSRARDGELQFTHGTIEATKIKTMVASPIEMVPGAGEGTFLEFCGVWLILEAGSEGLTESSDNLIVYWTDGTGDELSITIEMTNFITRTSDYITYGGPNTTEPIVAVATANNAPLVLSGTSGEFAGNASNDAKLHWRCAYRVHYFFQP